VNEINKVNLTGLLCQNEGVVTEKILMSNKLSGFCAFIGSWLAMQSIGQVALSLESFGAIMIFGVITCWTAEAIQKWIEA